MKNPYKMIKCAFIVLLAIVAISLVYITTSGMPRITDKVYSPDKGTKQIVYFHKKNSSSNKENSIEIKVHDNNGRSKTSYMFDGEYGGIHWTSDSSKYVIKVKGYISNIYVVDGDNGEITGIDNSLDIALQSKIKDNPDSFNFTIDKELNADYEFIKWESNNESMLIFYKLTDLDKKVHSGYFLYDLKSNKINGILSSIE